MKQTITFNIFYTILCSILLAILFFISINITPVFAMGDGADSGDGGDSGSSADSAEAGGFGNSASGEFGDTGVGGLDGGGYGTGAAGEFGGSDNSGQGNSGETAGSFGGGNPGTGDIGGQTGGSGSDSSGSGSTGSGSGSGSSGSGSTGSGSGSGSSGSTSGLFGRGGFLGLGIGTGSGISGLFGGIVDAISGLFSGSGSTDTEVGGFPDAGGGDNRGIDRVVSDLIPETTTIRITETTTTFLGQITKVTNTGAAGDSASTILTNTLLIDYDCDDSVDIEKDFTTPYVTIQSGNDRIIPLSVQDENGSAGTHCFAFKVDTEDIVTETNESNNQTGWHTFTVESTKIPVDPGFDCPIVYPAQCTDDEQLVSRGTGSNGCALSPECVATSDITPDAIMFEVKAYQKSNTGGVPIYTVRHDWTSEAVTVARTAKLYFKWDARNYDQCLTSLHPEHYDFSTSVTQNIGNTETSDQAMNTVDGIYAIECVAGNIKNKKEIRVTVE